MALPASAPGHYLAAGRELREELAVEGLVELQRYALADAVEDDRRYRPSVEAVNHTEVEDHLVALVRRDRALEVPALGLADDEAAVPVIPEQDVGVAGETIRMEHVVRPVAAEIARDDANGGRIEAPARADAR